MIAITRGVRTTTFDVDGNVVSMVDDFGEGGTTEFLSPWEFADPEVVAEMRERIAAVDEPRRRRTK